VARRPVAMRHAMSIFFPRGARESPDEDDGHESEAEIHSYHQPWGC
jgi:hypothetical protein